jgi:F-type H+-transporting ATPase subunit b
MAASAAAEASHHEGASEDSLTLWKFANFALLVGVAGYFIKKKSGAFFAGRTAEIRQGLEEAARLKKDAEGRYAEMEERLASLGVEVENLRKQAGQESAAEGERIRAEMDREMQKIQAQAEQEIAAAAKAARQHLRAYSAELAVDLAAKRIRERLTPDSDSALVQAMLKDLEHRPSGEAVRAS